MTSDHPESLEALCLLAFKIAAAGERLLYTLFLMCEEDRGGKDRPIVLDGRIVFFQDASSAHTVCALRPPLPPQPLLRPRRGAVHAGRSDRPRGWRERVRVRKWGPGEFRGSLWITGRLLLRSGKEDRPWGDYVCQV